jgi:hypothetical protein
MPNSDITEIRQEFSDDTAEWSPIRKEGTTDMRHVSGDPWDPAEREKREKAGRLCLSLDELNQYTNQVVNEVRANKRAVKFTAQGDGANDESAAFYADKMREIEHRSRASIGYTTAFENAVQRSYGFCRVATRYESSRSVNQDIWIDPIHNPDLVTPDPYALMPDLSDMKHCWVREAWPIEAFNQRFGEHKIDKGGLGHRALMSEAGQWVSDRIVWVSEYWKIKYRKRKLLVVLPQAMPAPGGVLGSIRSDADAEPVGIFEDEIGSRYKGQLPGRVVTTRDVDDPQVYQCLTNGVEILEETDWPGKYIPIVSCFGKVIYVDEDAGSKRRLLSMVRLARDPYMLLCYIRTCEAELIGQVPKFPYFVYEGQLSPLELDNLIKSVYEPVAVVQVKATTQGVQPGTVLPHPQRNTFEPAIQALEIAAESMRRAIQSAMGLSFLPTTAQRRNEKSGVALKHIEEVGQRGSFHFTDHYLDMITQVGVIVEDLMDKIYDSSRKVGIRKANDDAEIVAINGAGPKVISTKGTHLVTVSTGPSFDSEREAASDFADTLAQISPEIFQALGPLIVKLKNLGPIGDEMIEILEAIQPAPIQAVRQSKLQGGKVDPQAAQKQLVQAQAQIQQLTAMAEQMKQALDSDAAKQKGAIDKAKIDSQTQIRLQQMRDATALAVAKINALTKGVTSVNEQQVEAIALAHEAEQAELDRQHEHDLAAVEHARALALGEQAHQQGLEAGEIGHQQGLEAGEQAISGQLAVTAAKPKPTSGAGA